MLKSVSYGWTKTGTQIRKCVGRKLFLPRSPRKIKKNQERSEVLYCSIYYYCCTYPAPTSLRPAQRAALDGIAAISQPAAPAGKVLHAGQTKTTTLHISRTDHVYGSASSSVPGPRYEFRRKDM